MKVMETHLAGVKIIEPDLFRDERGFFMESYHTDKYAASGMTYTFIQDNHSLSEKAGTLRGLHYQCSPKPQTKLVRAVVGAIYDVAVDIRLNSVTFGQWVGVILSASNHRQLLIPQGFAHGFCTLVPNTEVVYKVDHFYAAELDRGICWHDAALSIPWPTDQPFVSAKDAQLPMLADAELDDEMEVPR